MNHFCKWLAGGLVLSFLVVNLPVRAQVMAQAKEQSLKQAPEPSHQALLELLNAEIKTGLAKRNQSAAFDRYLSWTANRLDASAGEKTWSDKTGNARLKWVDKMLREPLWAIGESERFSASLFAMAHDSKAGLFQLMAAARLKLDLPASEQAPPQLQAANADQVIQAVTDALVKADAAMTNALKPLSLREHRELEKHLYAVTTGDVEFGYSFSNQRLGRRVCDLIEKVDRQFVLAAGEAVIPLTTLDIQAAFANYKPAADAAVPLQVPGVSGRILQRIKTDAGDIIIGSKEDNIYDLDHMPNVAAIIDLGGNDTYLDGQVGRKRQAMVIIDLQGNDIYRGTKPGIQGGAILGVSLLLDLQGNNTYEAQDIAQGACLVGVGILIDRGDNTTYQAMRRAQGSAIAGVGLLLDEKGDDHYRAALLSQGVGGPWGLGLAIDLQGKDNFYAGGVFASSYNDSPGFEAWSQGVGVGPRGVANGGIGMLLSGPGDDVYECDYFSHGGGYWFAVGVARDFAGNDQRVGATRTAYDGGERKVKRFLRWGIGFQAHYGVGFVIDDQGNDHYEANSACLGFSWDIGTAAIIDFQGDDVYVNPRAQGSEAAFGFLFDAQGNDTYRGGAQGDAREKVNYHPMPQAGGNFSFLIDYGGKNTFAKDIADHSYNQRGAPTGFLISRPDTPTLQQIQQDAAAGK